MMHEFPDEKTCPTCRGVIKTAERKNEYDPVVVVVCPHCSELLWRPGLDDDSPLFPFDPNAENGI